MASMRAEHFLYFNSGIIWGEGLVPVGCIWAPWWLRLLSVLRWWFCEKTVRKESIVAQVPVISLFWSALARLIGLDFICIPFSPDFQLNDLQAYLATHFLLAPTDLLNDAIPFSLDGTPALALSALNSNPQAS